jgi:hypothetical protein
MITKDTFIQIFYNLLSQSSKNFGVASCWWITPVILATQEAEIRRIAV